MNIHEYQAKKIFADYGIPVPAGHPAFSAEEARRSAQEIGGTEWMVKAQIHAGGRGKAGGVKKAKSLDEVSAIAHELIGKQLITYQNAPKGQPVNCVLVETPTAIQSELYLSMLVDRSSKRIAIIASSAGGMDIEHVAATTPEKIFTLKVDPVAGLQPYQSREVSFALGLNDEQRKQMGALLPKLYQVFMEKDLSLIEVNPLVIDTKGNLIALDGKITVDDNALYRQSLLKSFYDPSQVDEKEHRAGQFDLNYVALDGDIACMVNGAGLAMATMDVIKLSGGEPANFLDVGGGTNAEKVTEAFKLILSDTKVKAILVNILGGIVKCDMIAQGVITAIQQTGTTLPVVVRLAGTNVDAGKELLRNSGLAVIPADDLDDAAAKAVSAVRGG